MVNVNRPFILVFVLLLQLILSDSANPLLNHNHTDVNSILFELPSPLPSWPRPTGCDFATGVIDIGGLQIQQLSSFDKIFVTKAATFYQPSSIPAGFSMLGAYAQSNNQQLSGWVLVGQTNASDASGPILKSPVDYTLIAANIWLPVAPKGYAAVGLVVTASSNKPSMDSVRCVRSDYTEEAETDRLIWSDGRGLNVYSSRPKVRGANAPGVSVGTFIVQTNNQNTTVYCLKNVRAGNNSITSNPNLKQIQALFQLYAPLIILHPEEKYLPASVNFFFANGGLLYKKGEESKPVRIQPDGSNLPQGGSNDGAYWLDLPADDEGKTQMKGGDSLLSGPVYIHVKPVLGSTFTDIQVWIFYTFNGGAVLKMERFPKISLDKIGEHVGDWEHVTLRINNFDGALDSVYFAQHGGGEWVDASQVEFRGGNKVVAYASLNGHASYSRTGLVLQGNQRGAGIRDDMAKSNKVMDTGKNFSVVAAEGLSGAEAVVEPPWLNYTRAWGPKVDYDLQKELQKVERALSWPWLRKSFGRLIQSLPADYFGLEGPTGPKMKSVWNGDEK